MLIVLLPVGYFLYRWYEDEIKDFIWEFKKVKYLKSKDHKGVD